MKSEVIPSQHTESVLCCTMQPHGSRRLLLSGGEDGYLCFTDLKERRCLGRLRANEGDAIPSVCCSPTEEHSAFAAAGSSVLRLDLRKSLGEEAVLDTFNVNSDEVNSIAVDATSTWLAAGDDSGEVQVISLAQYKTPGRPNFKTLRRGHTNICSAVAFRPSRPSELLSGGLDCRMVRWDFTRLRQLTAFDMNAGAMAASNGQFCNPPMINSLSVCSEPDIEFPSLIAAARGDGCVALYNADHRPAAPAASTKGKKGASATATAATSSSEADKEETNKPSGALCWAAGTHQGGHTAAVNCVTFVEGTAGQRLFSVGNDRKFCVWDWQKAVEPAAELRHRAKINWVCSASASGSGMDAVMGDVSGRLIAVSVDS